MAPKKPVDLRRELRLPGKRIFVPSRLPPVPEKKWLSAGRQTQRTKAIIEFASGFHGNPVEIAKQAVREMMAFQEVPLDLKTLRQYYSKRTADEIIRSRKIAVGNQEVKGSGLQVNGCIDLCVALCAVLRAKKIPAMFIRKMDHSTVFFHNGEKWMSADPFFGNVGSIASSELDWIKRQKERPVEKRRYAEGLDAWDVGIKSLKDFAKYSIRAK